MGKTVAQYRWFAIFYLLFMFFLLPLYTFGLSLIGPVAIYVAFLPLLGKILILHPQFCIHVQCHPNDPGEVLLTALR